MGIEPPEPMVTALRPHSSVSAARALASTGMSQGSAMAALPREPKNSARQSAGSWARIWARKASRTFAGSCLPTRRKVTLAQASEGMTVFEPSPV
jgi:hypothetical protein